MDRRAEAAVIKAAARHVDMLDAGDSWQIAADGEATLVEVVDAAGVRTPILTFSRFAKADEIALVASALEFARVALGVISRAVDASRRDGSRQGARPAAGGAEPEKPKRTPAQWAAILCQHDGFKAFLAERHQLALPATHDQAAQRLRSVLRVSSRAEIDSDPRALEGWKAVWRDYKQWKGGR